MQDMNTVNIVCRLAADPELRSLASGTSVCSLRVAFNTSRKNNQTGEWEDVGNFINVSVWGKQGESLARNLTKGQRVGVSGRLEIRQYTDKDGNKREAAQITADRVQYLDPRQDGGNGNGGGQRPASRPVSAPATEPYQGNGGGGFDDDDIPF
jgi:single-strand DNA-binding protein